MSCASTYLLAVKHDIAEDLYVLLLKAKTLADFFHRKTKLVVYQNLQIVIQKGFLPLKQLIDTLLYHNLSGVSSFTATLIKHIFLLANYHCS